MEWWVGDWEKGGGVGGELAVPPQNCLLKGLRLSEEKEISHP